MSAVAELPSVDKDVQDDYESKKASHEERLAQQERINRQIGELHFERDNMSAVEARDEELQRIRTEGLDLSDPEFNPRDVRDEIGQRIAELERRKSILDRVLKIDERELADANRKYSKEVCDRLRPDYVEILRDIVQAVATCQVALTTERGFRDNLEEQGIKQGYLPHAAPPWFGSQDALADAPFEKIERWLKELKSDYPEIC